MLETLSLGGGVLYLKQDYQTSSFVDMGYCYSHEAGVDLVQELDYKYFTDSNGRLIRLPSTSGRITAISCTGSFIWESISRDMLQKIWFYGDNTSDGTDLFYTSELTPIIRALKYIPDVLMGPAVCFICPAVEMTVVSRFPFHGESFKNLTINYRAVFSHVQNTKPFLRVQEVDELLEDFCTEL